MNQKAIKDISKKFDLGEVKKIEKMSSNQNEVYKLTCEKGYYILKIYSKDAISNYYSLRKRKEQLRISELLNDNNISCIQPIKIGNNSFFFWQKKYCLVYPYLKSKNLMDVEITPEIISKLACIQAKIHKLNIHSSLPCSYQKINVDFTQIKKKWRRNTPVYNKIVGSENDLKELFNYNNQYISKVKNNLCISHNDYKHLNILLDGDNITLIDFDAMGLVNPTCALLESAFTFSEVNNSINKDLFTKYITSYQVEYGKIEDFDASLYVAMNGKIRWLCYLISKNNRGREVIQMIDTLLLYYKNIPEFKKIYDQIKN